MGMSFVGWTVEPGQGPSLREAREAATLGWGPETGAEEHRLKGHVIAGEETSRRQIVWG